MAADMVNPSQAVMLTIAGAIGGVMPDIDLGSSRQSRTLFGGLGIILAFSLLFNFSGRFSIVELWIMWLGIYLFTRYVIGGIFDKYARHRGVFHSLLASVFFMFATAAFCYYIAGLHSAISWLAGGFMFFGTIVHYVLDEMYSVDFAGNRLKKSFGTALKLFDYRNPATAIIMVGMVVVAFFVTPPADELVDMIAKNKTWSQLGSRMLPPDGNWFNLSLQ
jgi:membrane-bound metal-dependent hydrolase YbcI (DUF457 family)